MRLEQRLSIWQHPPTAGASVVQYQFMVPADGARLRFRAKVGIRNGSLIAESPDNYVAFRFYVNGVRLWSTTKNTTTWDDVSVDLPTLAGQYSPSSLSPTAWATRAGTGRCGARRY